MKLKPAGVLFALLSAATFAVMGYFAKHLSREMPSSEVVFHRGLIGVLLLLPWCWRDFGKLVAPSSQFLWLRGIAGAASALCYFGTMARTTVANARAIADIAPLFVVILGWRFLGERPTRWQLGYVAVGLLGTSLLGVPGSGSCPPEAWAIGIAGAVFASLAYFSLRQASQRFPMSLTVFIFMAALVLTSLLFVQTGWVWPTQKGWIAIGIIGVTGMLAQLWMTAAYARLPAFLGTAFGLSALPMIALVELVFDGEVPVRTELAAYSLILLSVLLHANSSLRRRSQPAANTVDEVLVSEITDQEKSVRIEVKLDQQLTLSVDELEPGNSRS